LDELEGVSGGEHDPHPTGSSSPILMIDMRSEVAKRLEGPLGPVRNTTED
jgi:hypothetical protein